MKPGKELDKLVAEAMGYGSFWLDKEAGQWYAFHPDHTNLEDERIPVPQFSTDGYAGWEALGWLEKNHPWEQVALSRRAGHPCILELLSPATKNFPNSWGIEEIAVGETYPHAICLAILRSKKL